MLHKLRQAIHPYLTLNNGVLVVALLITLTWVWGTVQAIQRNFMLQQQVDTMQQQIALDQLQNQTLQLQNNYYQTPEFLELQAREQLGKAEPGEKVVILPPNKATPVPPPSDETPVKALKDRSNFEQWFYFLFANKNS